MLPLTSWQVGRRLALRRPSLLHPCPAPLHIPFPSSPEPARQPVCLCMSSGRRPSLSRLSLNLYTTPHSLHALPPSYTFATHTTRHSPISTPSHAQSRAHDSSPSGVSAQPPPQRQHHFAVEIRICDNPYPAHSTAPHTCALLSTISEASTAASRPNFTRFASQHHHTHRHTQALPLQRRLYCLTLRLQHQPVLIQLLFSLKLLPVLLDRPPCCRRRLPRLAWKDLLRQTSFATRAMQPTFCSSRKFESSGSLASSSVFQPTT